MTFVRMNLFCSNLLSERMNIVQLWKTVKVGNNLVAIFNSRTRKMIKNTV